MSNPPPLPSSRVSEAFAYWFQAVERLLYILVGSALALAGFILFGNVVYTWGREVFVGRRSVGDALLAGVDGLLLVFIFAELLHTVRVVVSQDELRTEPFLVVGIVAVVRRIIVASAEGSKALGSDHFHDLMIELSVLIAAVLLLSGSIALLRHQGGPSPRFPKEPDEPDE
jgi:uncharacterized membrane protein (DUF373 family)